MSEMTAGVMRQRYVDGHPFAHDLTRIESIPPILRDLAETWLRITIVAPMSPGRTQLQACADYAASLADMIDGALIAEAESDAAHWDGES